MHDEFNKGNIVPESLEQVLLCDYAQLDKIKLKSTLQNFFKGFAVDYSKTVTEYSLYYFAVNIFKIWKPLIDLTERNQLKDKMQVLEIGCGPGSSTFGFIEFYRFMALERPNTEFALTFTLIEQHAEFFEMFKRLFGSYKTILPKNLSIYIAETITESVCENIKTTAQTKFNLVMASNVFNCNELNGIKHFKTLMTNLKSHIQNDGSIIVIEPAEKANSVPFLKLRNELDNEKVLNIFSPCNCMYEIPHTLCCAFSMARAYIKKSAVLETLKRDGIITNNNPLVHNFQYAIFRKDDLRKYDVIRKNHDKLCDINKKEVGSRVNIYAQIVTTAPDHDFLHICDGTLAENKKIKMQLSNFKMSGMDSQIIRGERIVLKGAIVQGVDRLTIDAKTKVEVYF